MVDLKDALDVLYELNELRSRAKELREQGRLALKGIDKTETSEDGTVSLRPSKPLPREEWISSGNNVEVGLLVKVQNHQDISEDDQENDQAEAAPLLKTKLRELKLDKLFPRTDYDAEIVDEEKGDPEGSRAGSGTFYAGFGWSLRKRIFQSNYALLLPDRPRALCGGTTRLDNRSCKSGRRRNDFSFCYRGVHSCHFRFWRCHETHCSVLQANRSITWQV